MAMNTKAREDQSVVSELQRAGLRVTGPRSRILSLFRSTKGPLSSEEVHGKLKGSINLVTVYRTLQTLTESHLLRRSDLADGLQRYELDQGEHRHYIVCRSCQEIEPLAHCVFEPLEVRLKEMGYQRITHNLEITALCQSCQKAS